MLHLAHSHINTACQCQKHCILRRTRTRTIHRTSIAQCPYDLVQSALHKNVCTYLHWNTESKESTCGAHPGYNLIIWLFSFYWFFEDCIKNKKQKKNVSDVTDDTDISNIYS